MTIQQQIKWIEYLQSFCNDNTSKSKYESILNTLYEYRDMKIQENENYYNSK